MNSVFSINQCLNNTLEQSNMMRKWKIVIMIFLKKCHSIPFPNVGEFQDFNFTVEDTPYCSHDSILLHWYIKIIFSHTHKRRDTCTDKDIQCLTTKEK